MALILFNDRFVNLMAEDVKEIIKESYNPMETFKMEEQYGSLYFK
ncbi:hypothetical protein SRA_08031 [Streptococcus ratti FA-1 = DSM 20564]|uniref:Uncharacterized protein n=1 Tax=Streptococcus ratti FA-1 = DSM 20564 TaxID=699248 RepID=A0ABP2QZK3_STRRT|nr:hypothetical protein SRA_08031 [Streptococcus ratti FA-1 = DSM 20564]